MDNQTVGIIEPVGGHGGMDYYDYGLASGLGNQGVNVRFYTCDKTTVRNFKNVLTLLPFVNMWKRSFLIKTSKYLSGHLTAFNDLIQNNGRIVHLHFFALRSIDLLILSVAKIRGLKIIATIHDVTSFHGKANEWIEDRCYKLIDGVIVHNNSSFIVLEKKIEKVQIKTAIIPHGNYLPFIQKKNAVISDNKVFTILFFGQIKKVKGLDVLINAVSVLKAQGIHIKLLIAGKAWKSDLEEYIKLIDDLGLSDIVTTDFRYIPDNEVADYYSLADLVVLPYKEIYQSGVLLLTMSYSKPVLCSDLLPFQEIIEDGINGFLFKSEDIQDLANKLIYIIKGGAALRSSIILESDSIINLKYNWNTIGRQTSDFYREVLEGS